MSRGPTTTTKNNVHWSFGVVGWFVRSKTKNSAQKKSYPKKKNIVSKQNFYHEIIFNITSHTNKKLPNNNKTGTQLNNNNLKTMQCSRDFKFCWRQQKIAQQQQNRNTIKQQQQPENNAMFARLKILLTWLINYLEIEKRVPPLLFFNIALFQQLKGTNNSNNNKSQQNNNTTTQQNKTTKQQNNKTTKQQNNKTTTANNSVHQAFGKKKNNSPTNNE